MKVSVCTRPGLVVRQVANVLSTVCCFSSRKPHKRDEIKAFRGSRLRDGATELRWRVSPAEDVDEEDGEPGSGDEDVLTSLGASYRAWRVYHREKRAHDYTKSRLVEAFRREAALVKQLARVGGTAEGVERTLMRLEDLETTVVSLEEKYDTVMTGQLAREAIPTEARQVHIDRLHEAEAAALHWKSQCQEVLPELAVSNLEKQRLAGELRKVKKAAVLAMNRQYIQLDATNAASQSLLNAARHHERKSKKRPYSDNEIN